MTEFLFIRHGESVANTNLERIGGRNNLSPLTERGREQAMHVGNYLKDLPAPDAIFSSGAVRANETAAIALKQAKIHHSVHHDDRLLEMSLGDYEGRLRTEVYTPEIIAQYDILSLTGKLPGTESMYDVGERMLDFLREKTKLHPHDRIYIFGHGLAFRTLIGRINNLDKQAIRSLTVNNVSLTRIETNLDSHTIHFVGKNVIPEYT